MIKSYLLISTLIFITCSCSINIKKNKGDFRKIGMQKVVGDSKNFVDEISVAILDFESPKDSELSKKYNLGSIANQEIEKIISNNKSVNIVDRKTSDQLLQEFKLAELKKDKFNGIVFNSPQLRDVDYVITGNINEVVYSNKFVSHAMMNMGAKFAMIAGSVAAMSSNSSSDIGVAGLLGGMGTDKIVSDEYRHNATISGVIRIINTKTGSEDARILFEGIAEESEDANSNTVSTIIGGASTVVQKSETMDRLIVNCLKSAFKKDYDKIFNNFAPQGHVIDRMDHPKGKYSIYRISFGTKDGIKEGDEISFEFKEEITNPLTNQIEYSTDIATTGVVSNDYNENYSWVIVKDKASIAKIKIGTKARKILKK